MARDFGTHVLRALTRVELVLREHLADELADALDVGLYAPAPCGATNFEVLASPEDLAHAVVNEDLAVFVYPAEDNSSIASYSGSAVASRELIEWPIAVHLRFAVPASEPFVAHGRVLTDAGKRGRIALAYQTAIINVMDKYVTNGDDVLMADLLKNVVNTEYNGETAAFGRVHTEWQIKQIVERHKL